MCPKNDDNKSVKSDCSIDQERETFGCEGGGMIYSTMMGYRSDHTADGACESLRSFHAKVVSKDGVSVGDYDNKTRLMERFAGGSFGELYIGEMINCKNKRVAVKIEPQGPFINLLLHEGGVYRNLEGGPGIPKVYWFGFHGSDYRALIMDLLGPTLDYYFTRCNRKFSMKIVLQLALQMVDILAFIHSNGYVHRDISPSNFVIGGEGKENELFLIDFGHAKRYNDTMRLMPRRNSTVAASTRAVVGTPRFISLHAHLSHEEGPRDDVEALGYILVYLAAGRLPWQGLQAHSMVEKLNKIAEKKMKTSIEELCDGLPEEFMIFISYTRQLKLYEPIDYEGMKSLFRGLASKLELNLDQKFEWETQECADQHDTGGTSVSTEDGPGGPESLNNTPPSR